MLKCDTYIITKFTIKFKRNFKMNKGLHRIIFNKKHGTMVAVAENTNSQGKGRQAGASSSHTVSDDSHVSLGSTLKTTLKTLVCSLVSLKYGCSCQCTNYY